jgi:hypothetical protein
MGLHAGILDLESSGLAGPYAYAVNVAETGAVTAAHATLARVDIMWVRLDDPAESDGSAAPVVVAGYTAGTAASTPVAPATPARCMVLATIQVPMSGGGSPTVIWVAPYTVAAGAPTLVWSAADRDAKFPVPYDGLAVYRLDLHAAEIYNGTAWGMANQTVTAKTTANVPTAGGAVSVPVVTAPNVIGDGVKKFKITASVPMVSGTVVTDHFYFSIIDATLGSTLVGNLLSPFVTTTAGIFAAGATYTAYDVPAVGPHGYRLDYIRAYGTGTGTVYAPAEIIVEQIA